MTRVERGWRGGIRDRRVRRHQQTCRVAGGWD